MAITERILIEYKAIMDEDLAMVFMMRDNFCSPKVMDEEFIKEKDNLLAVKRRLATRDNPNPLHACVKSSLWGDTTASLYRQLIEQHYAEIVDKTTPSVIATVISTLQRNPNNNMRCAILCTKKEQVEKIRVYDDKLEILYIPDFDENGLDVANYTSIFCKDIINLIRYRNLEAKNIYIARLIYNLDYVMGEFKPKIAVMDLLGRTNKLNLIDYYTTS